jgi:hypothetical protein
VSRVFLPQQLIAELLNIVSWTTTDVLPHLREREQTVANVWGQSRGPATRLWQYVVASSRVAGHIEGLQCTIGRGLPAARRRRVRITGSQIAQVLTNPGDYVGSITERDGQAN